MLNIVGSDQLEEPAIACRSPLTIPHKRTSPLANHPFGPHIDVMESTNVIPFPQRNAPSYDLVSFHRRELADILSIYGQLVAAGEWRPRCRGFLGFPAHGGNPGLSHRKTPEECGKARRLLHFRFGRAGVEAWGRSEDDAPYLQSKALEAGG